MTQSGAESVTLESGDIVLQKYRVEHKLGQGGMGIVVAVRHVDLGELFAMKVLLNTALARPGAVERFLREARSAARLKTDHVVRVFDIGKLPTGEPYMLMEYLRGKDLATVLDDKSMLPAREVVDFMLEAVDAIAEAHAMGVVHRDLKPSNLFVAARRDNLPLLKVLDFGISKELNAHDQATTHSASVMGSPYYMSPEHMRSAKHVGPKTDIWSLGIIMFELLTGRIPFEGETPTEVCANVLEMDVPSIRALAPETPEALEEIVKRCLRRSPDERYSAAELQVALEEVSVSLGDAPRSLLSTGSWLKARHSLSGVKFGTTSDPSGRARANVETLDQQAGGAARGSSSIPSGTTNNSQGPSIQGWSQPAPSSRKLSPVLIVSGIAVAGALAWGGYKLTRHAPTAELHDASPASAALTSTENPSSTLTTSAAIATAPAAAALAAPTAAPSGDSVPSSGPVSSSAASAAVPARPVQRATTPPVAAAKPPPPPTADPATPALKRPKF